MRAEAMTDTATQQKDIHAKGLKLAKKSPWFHKLKRSYPDVAGYESFSTVAQHLAFNLFSLFFCLDRELLTPQDFLADFAWSSTVLAAWTLAHNPFPVWWLDKDLFEAFDQSDIPKAVANLQVSVPFGILMLPRGIQNPDGESCHWISFEHFSAGHQLPIMQFGLHTIASLPVDCEKLRWLTVLQNGTRYASTVEFAGDHLVHGSFGTVGDEGAPDANRDVELEQQFLNRVEKIIIQTLLYLQIRPDDLTAPQKVPVSHKGQGFGGQKSSTDRLTPLIIGQQFQPQTERISRSSHSTHATPRTHWRRGHWRRVAVGEGRQERKWRWIQPVLVNG
jgi:hypothetical protein